MLAQIKTGLALPENDMEDDELLKGYLAGAEAYLLNACDIDTDEQQEKILADSRSQYFMIELVMYMYQNRSENLPSLSFILSAMLNQIRYSVIE